MYAKGGRKPKLLVTRKLPPEIERRVAASYDAIANFEDLPLDGAEIVARAAGRDALLVCPTEKFDAGMIAALPASVRIITTFSVGYDHIDAEAAGARGIVVTNTPDVLSDATADLAMLALLGAARGAGWGERMVRGKTWGRWAPTGPLGVDVTGKRLGILGMGRIGRAMARRARGFDMDIHYHNRTRLPADLEQDATFHDQLASLLAVSDFLSIHCASTPETRGIIDAAAIARLPDGAVVVNTARGDIIDDDALVAALQSGRLAAAGLDVFAGEPDIDPRYRTLDNTFLLPHLGSATTETRNAMGHRALDNLDAFFAGRRPADQVNSPATPIDHPGSTATS